MWIWDLPSSSCFSSASSWSLRSSAVPRQWLTLMAPSPLLPIRRSRSLTDGCFGPSHVVNTLPVLGLSFYEDHTCKCGVETVNGAHGLTNEKSKLVTLTIQLACCTSLNLLHGFGVVLGLFHYCVSINSENERHKHLTRKKKTIAS